jgi:septal ring factor EnvC (AmiA/AmiB activator)
MISLLLRSRTSCALLALAAVLSGFLVWHTIDRSSAVRRAVTEYVANAELTAIRMELSELKRRNMVSDTAKRQLQTEIDKANAQAEAAVEELEHYVSAVEDNCVVHPDLVERLRDR